MQALGLLLLTNVVFATVTPAAAEDEVDIRRLLSGRNSDEEEDEDQSSRLALEKDASEIQAQRERIERARQAEEMRKRSNVLKRDLPRPMKVNKAMIPENIENETDLELARTTLKLVKYDSVKFPLVSTKKKRRVPQLEALTEAELSNARDLVQKEYSKQKGMDYERFCEVWNKLVQQRVYVPSREAYANANDLSKSELLNSLQGRYEDLMKRIQRDSTHALKLEKKIGVMYKGYTKVHEKLVRKLGEAQSELDETESQRLSFLRLMYNEERALPRRLHEARDALLREESRGNSLQNRYKELEREYSRLYSEVNSK